MISFSDTKLAFKNKSNQGLRKAIFLFSIVQYPLFVKILKVVAVYALRIRFPFAKNIIEATVFQQFCGGKSLDECRITTENLSTSNIHTILDYSVEHEQSEVTYDKVVQEKMRILSVAEKDKWMPIIVLKPTAIARFALLEKVHNSSPLSEKEELEYARVMGRVGSICDAASKGNVKIFFDAEESWIQDAVDQMARNMMEKYNKIKPIVYNTFQMYRWEMLARLKEEFARAEKYNYHLGAKLVRGAYMEQERERALQMRYVSPIHKTKEETDRDFDTAMKFLVENCQNTSLCSGTHNKNSILQLISLLSANGIAKNDPNFWFAQLYGMSDDITYNLAREGYNVAKYVPYGPVEHVFPYLIRRAEENSAVQDQSGRELALLREEIIRRKGHR